MTWQLRVTKANTLRSTLNPRDVIDFTYAIEEQGGFADFSMTMLGEDIAASNLEVDDRVELWNPDVVPAVRKYRGYVSEINPTEDDDVTFEIIGYGMMLMLERIILDAFFQYPNDVDLSIVFADIFAEVKRRYPNIVSEIDFVGINTDSYDARGKTAASALSDLLSFASGTLRYGFDVDPSGYDRLYLRSLVDYSTAEPDHTIGIQEPIVTSAGLRRSVSDLFNVIIIEGGTPKYPQLLPNGSFEVLRRSAENDGNIVANPSFEDGTTWWTFASGASRKGETQEGTNARTGVGAGEVDQIGEIISQDEAVPRIAIVPGRDYSFSFYACPESSYDPTDPPLLDYSILWKDAAGATLQTDTRSALIRERTWNIYDMTTRAPAGATRFKISFQLNAGSSYGTNKGVWIDDVNLSDATTMYAVGWGVDARGTSIVTSLNWNASGAKHGQNCLEITGTALDSFDDDILIQPMPEYLIDVIPGQHLEFSLYMQSLGRNIPLPKTMMKIDWRDKDNKPTGTGPVTDSSTAGMILNDWTWQNVHGIVPVDAVKCVIEFRIRSNGGCRIDCLGLRNYAETSDLYIEEGTFRLRLRADEMIPLAEDAEAHNSIATWGMRDRVVNTEATTIAEATKLAKSILLQNCKFSPEPTLTFRDDTRFWWTDQRVKFVGFKASFWQAGLMPVVRIAGGIVDDSIDETVTFLRIKPTTEDLLRRMQVGDDKDKNTVGSGGTTGGVYAGGGTSSGTGSPPYTGLPGSIPFVSAAGTLTESNTTLFRSSTSGNIGIGTNGPVAGLHVKLGGTGQGDQPIFESTNNAGINIYNNNGVLDAKRWVISANVTDDSINFRTLSDDGTLILATPLTIFRTGALSSSSTIRAYGGYLASNGSVGQTINTGGGTFTNGLLTSGALNSAGTQLLSGYGDPPAFTGIEDQYYFDVDSMGPGFGNFWHFISGDWYLEANFGGGGGGSPYEEITVYEATVNIVNAHTDPPTAGDYLMPQTTGGKVIFKSYFNQATTYNMINAYPSSAGKEVMIIATEDFGSGETTVTGVWDGSDATPLDGVETLPSNGDNIVLQITNGGNHYIKSIRKDTV